MSYGYLVRQKALEQTQKVSPQAQKVSLMVALTTAISAGEADFTQLWRSCESPASRSPECRDERQQSTSPRVARSLLVSSSPHGTARNSRLVLRPTGAPSPKAIRERIVKKLESVCSSSRRDAWVHQARTHFPPTGSMPAAPPWTKPGMTLGFLPRPYVSNASAEPALLCFQRRASWHAARIA